MTAGTPETIDDVLRLQRRKRRLRFWAGALVIVLLGSLWAGLSKDPIGPNLIGFNEPAVERVEVEPAVEVELVPETTVAFEIVEDE